MKANQISDAGTSITLDAGEGTNNILRLNGEAKLPQIDGANLQNVGGGGGGAFKPSVVTLTAASSITLGTTYANGTIIYVDTSVATTQPNVFLPLAGAFSSGYFLEISRNGANSGYSSQSMYVKPSGSDTISGNLSSRLFSIHDAYTFVSDGSSVWYYIGTGLT